MYPKRFCWWQMNTQSVFPLGEPDGTTYSGRCCNREAEEKRGISNGRCPCFYNAEDYKTCPFHREFHEKDV